VAGRKFASVIGVAAGVSVASLVLAQLISHHGAVSVLFVIFLIATFTLLAGAVFTSEQWVQGVWASRESWSQAPRKRLVRRARIAVRDGVVRVGRLMGVAVARLRLALTGEGRRATFAALRRMSRDALEQLGLPLDQDDVAPAPVHATPSRRAMLRHRRGEERRRTFMPAEYRAARDALERAAAAAKAPEQRAEAHHPKADTNTLQRAFTAKRGRAAREALKKAGHTAFVSAMGILPDRSGSLTTK
jgi:hypothetical protein